MDGLEIMITALFGKYLTESSIKVLFTHCNLYSMPTIPFITKKANTSPFYGPDDEIPVLVTILMGLQRK